MTENFSTCDLDLAAAVMVAAGCDPEVVPDPTNPQVARFVFDDTPRVRAVVMAYTSDQLTVPARQYAGIRHRLFKLARSMRWGGGR